MQHQLGSVEVAVPMRLLVEGSDTIVLLASLRYEVQDPYAVQATFTAGDASVAWILARNLLQQGLVDVAGEGDVQVWPELGDDSEPGVRIRLSSPDGVAMLCVDADVLQGFLQRTFTLVPAGIEGQHLDLDACLDQLLSRP